MNLRKLPVIMALGDRLSFRKGDNWIGGNIQYIFSTHIVIDSEYGTPSLLDRNDTFLDLTYTPTALPPHDIKNRY